MIKHFFILACLTISSQGYTYNPPVVRPESREARAGFYVNIGDYVDPNLCDSTDGLGKGSMYYFVEQPGLMQDQITLCLLDLPNDGTTASRPVNINSQQENDCLVKYINRELRPDPERNYVIGLQDQSTQGVWEWQQAISDDLISLSFSHWAPEEPDGELDENCAYFTAAEDNHLSGFWRDDNCIVAGYYAICEEYLIAGPTTTAAATTAGGGSTAGSATTATGTAAP